MRKNRRPSKKSRARKTIVAMSGGVDSSVAAQMLKKQNHEVMGIFLHFWKERGAKEENKCCSTTALMDARRVCQMLGIKLYTLNFSKEFKQDVVDYFLDAYKHGATPNPCVKCNKFVKLGLLIKRAQELGFDRVASGHYARLKQTGNKYRLYRAEDKAKDQSYFLWALTQEQLSSLVFPLGNYTKDKVRKIAKKHSLPVASKKESQEICFIPGKSHNDFLKKHLKLKPGPIVHLTPVPLKTPPRLDKLGTPPLIRGGDGGGVIGEHQGLPLYTLGQRKGIEIGGTGPYYAARMDYKTNTLYVVEDKDDPVLYSGNLVARDVNWISGEEPKLPLKCEAVIRYRSKPVKCKVESYKVKSKKLKVIFDKPQRAVTVGQSVVFYGIRRGATNAAHPNEYSEDEVIGGGIIN